jgi:hypothetical protein
VVDAGLLAAADQREANAVIATATEPCAPRSAGRIDDGAEDLLVKRSGFFQVRDVDEDVVDAGGAEQRLALGGDRRGRGGLAEAVPGVFGPELNQRAVGVGNEEADAGGFAVLDAHLIQRVFGGGEIEIQDAGTEVVDHLRSLTLAGWRHGDVVGTELDVVARVGFLLQNGVTEDACVEVDGFFGVIDREGEMIECAEAEGRVGGESGAGGEGPGSERREGLAAGKKSSGARGCDSSFEA